MEVETTPIEGLLVVHRQIFQDKRGAFTRLFAKDEMNDFLDFEALHVNSSTSREPGTLRGIHFQYPPYAEAKLVSCVSGAIWDVGVDLRPESPTRFQWFGVELTPENGKSLIVPRGFGHGFLTLEQNSTVVYVVSAAYRPEHESGLRFDDEVMGIDWPHPITTVSEKDLLWAKASDRQEELSQKFMKNRDSHD
jgi:dTDP-4-dehydrorhamnose 3,5-epimerase